VLFIGRLGDISSITVTGRGDEFSLNLWFDKNGDNDFFCWNGSTYSSGGVDKYIADGTATCSAIDTYAFAPGSTNGVLSVNDETAFYSMQDGQSHTLSQLKAGSMGVGAETPIAIWVGVAGANKVTRIDSVNINGQ
jgi:hypothetical protein